MTEPVLILGGMSSIARASANAFAAKGHPIFLAGRDTQELARVAADIKVRYGVPVSYGRFDAEAFDEHLPFVQHVVKEMGALQGVLLAFGDLGDHTAATADFGKAAAIINRNYTGACSILTHCANHLGKAGKGFIIGISSVAGDRGRQSNYIYGSAKAGLTAFLQGLRNRMFHSGVRVITVKPGFVDTAMTFGKPGLVLVATPESIGNSIVKALDKSRDEIYLPSFWRYIMMIVRNVPEFIFKRLKL